MVLSKETSVREVVEYLKQDHAVKYNLLPVAEPFVVFRKDRGFGPYLFLQQKDKIIFSLKCAADGESFVAMKQIVRQALEELGYSLLED